MAPNISIRKYIQWFPDPASEPTSTVVTTSSQNRYVDIRVNESLNADTTKKSSQHEGIQPFSLLDWAFAGVSSSRQKFEPSNETTVHTVWKHWIDSRIPEAESVQDEADVFPQPDGSAVEQGRMVNPDNGQEMDYEEAWIDVAPTSTTLDNRKLSACAVLLLDDDSQRQRGMVVRVGQYCQGIVRIGEAVSLERWHWTKQDGWKRKVRMGDVWMPCGLAMEFSRLTLGGEVKQGEQSWKVVELMEFQSEL